MIGAEPSMDKTDDSQQLMEAHAEHLKAQFSSATTDDEKSEVFEVRRNEKGLTHLLTKK